jgi:hypothetical protein
MKTTDRCPVPTELFWPFAASWDSTDARVKSATADATQDWMKQRGNESGWLPTRPLARHSQRHLNDPLTAPPPPTAPPVPHAWGAEHIVSPYADRLRDAALGDHVCQRFVVTVKEER